MNRLRYHPIRWLPSMGLAAALFFPLALPAQAVVSGPYSMEILVDGIPLSEFQSRNKTYVEALENREYSIRLTNHTGQRIAVALSVDGLNSIDAKTTSARDASKWILGPYDSITLDGWQTSSDTARRFFFTTEEQSYGAWLGKTTNLGVIAAAVFREKQVRPTRPPQPIEENRRDASGRSSGPRPKAAPGIGSTAPAPSAGEMEGQRQDRFEKSSDDLAATGIGRELDHSVRRVRFRSEKTPVSTIEVRYEYRDALVALGVLPRPRPHRSRLSQRERARGFTDSGFAPDPFRAPLQR